MKLANLRSVDEMSRQGYLMYEKTYKEYIRDAAKFLKVAASRHSITDSKLQHIKTQEEMIVKLLPLAVKELGSL